MKGTTFNLLLLLSGMSSEVLAAPGTTAYSHGNPSAEEQYMLELINRARRDPVAEADFLTTVDDSIVRLAINFFNVNIARLKSDFASYDARPPIAFNPNLMESSRRHSKDMAKNNFQDHVGSDDSSVGSRIGDTGYPGSSLNESIYSNLVPNTLFAHVGFNIDWGSGAFGVQPGTGHRLSIMGVGSSNYREVGISIISRKGPDAVKFGLLSVTQDFGNQVASPDFLLGVAYYDVNGNGICDPGEGLPGVRVQPATGNRHAVTSASGGYAIPFPVPPGDSTLTFSGAGLAKKIPRDFSMSGENVKVDLRITSGTPFVSLTSMDKVASESGGMATFQLTRVGPADKPLRVTLGSRNGGGPGRASAADYKLTAVGPARITSRKASPGEFTVTIPAKRTVAEIKLAAVADNKAEPTETAIFSIIGSKSYRTGKPKSVRIRIKP